MTLDNQASLRHLIWDIVLEVWKLSTPAFDTPVAAIAAVVRDEPRHRFSAADLSGTQCQLSYTDVV